MHTNNLQKVSRRNTRVRGEEHFKTTVQCNVSSNNFSTIRKPYFVYLHHYLNLDCLCFHIMKGITPKIIKSNCNSDSTPFRLSLFTLLYCTLQRDEITIVPPYTKDVEEQMTSGDKEVVAVANVWGDSLSKCLKHLTGKYKQKTKGK